MHIRRFAALFIAAVPAIAQKPAGSSVIDGVASDSSLTPLAGVEVSLVGTRIRVVTDARGHFRVSGLPSGRTLLMANRLGYVPASALLDLDERDTARISLTLVPTATELDPVVVSADSRSARLIEFEARRKQGAGHFITEAEIEKHNAVYVADLLRTVPAVKVMALGQVSGAEAAYNMRGFNACPYQIFLDGVYLPPVDRQEISVAQQQAGAANRQSTPQPVAGREFAPRSLADLPSPKDLAGIEVYSGAATIPLQFKRPDTMCGIILLWTKDGSSKAAPSP